MSICIQITYVHIFTYTYKHIQEFWADLLLREHREHFGASLSARELKGMYLYIHLHIALSARTHI